MKVKELKQILDQFDDNLPIGAAIQIECDACENDIEAHIDTLYFDNIWYSPIANKIYIGGKGECN